MANEKVRQILENVFAEESTQAAAGWPFTGLACWDSLHYVQLVVAVQSGFGIELDQGQIQRIVTLEGLLGVLKEHNISS